MRFGTGHFPFRNGSVFDGTRFPRACTCATIGGGAHAHPVLVPNQLRHCDRHAANTEADYLEVIGASSSSHTSTTAAN